MIEVVDGGGIITQLVMDKKTNQKFLRIIIEHEELPKGGVWIKLDKEASIGHLNQVTQYVNMMDSDDQ